MTEIKTYCDHCGTELDKMTDYEDVEIEMAHKHQKVDLCVECFEELHCIIKLFCKQPIKKGGADS
jgi:hypothetical protein